VKILNRTCQAINLIGENAFQLSVSKIAEHFLECGTLHRVGGISTILINTVYSVIFLALTIGL
jgi:hypothetical protein